MAFSRAQQFITNDFKRQTGFKDPLGTRDKIYQQIYETMIVSGSWDPNTRYGGIFNLEFSPNGSILVAACEKRSAILLDPLTQKEIAVIDNAHRGCVNGVKFLDSNLFATCSDDYTVALWDARKPKEKMRSLHGHSNWVKNIEYSPGDGLLVTSGFDGSILTWEVNSYNEGGQEFEKVFTTNGLMRTKLSPDASKMIISTTGGYLILIHNLDLVNLKQDLFGFKPNMYRLMQLSQTILPLASDFTHIFRGRGKRNRVEFIADFPYNDDAEVISSLQIHPHGHSAISRNNTNDELSEWSCVHNIEERMTPDVSDVSEDEEASYSDDIIFHDNTQSHSNVQSLTPSFIVRQLNDSATPRTPPRSPGELPVSLCDVWEAVCAIQEARSRPGRSPLERPTLRTPRTSVNAGVQVRPNEVDEGEQSSDFNIEDLNQPSTSSVMRYPSQTQRPVERRNVSVNTTEIEAPTQREGNRVKRTFKPTYGFKVPAYYKMKYRYSRVGSNDRTSLRRRSSYKPYRRGRSRANVIEEYDEIPVTANSSINEEESSNVILNTNYEVNETERLEREREGGNGAHVDLRIRIVDRQIGSPPWGAGINVGEGQRSEMHRRFSSVLNSNVARFDDEPSAPGMSLQMPHSLPGRLSSEIHAEPGPSTSRDQIEPEIQQHSGHEGSDMIGMVDHEEEVESENNVYNALVNNHNQGNRRTIYMRVYRTRTRDGTRGTSLHSHNVAALTVSSGSSVTNRSRVSEEAPKPRSSKGYKTNPPRTNKKIYQNISRLTHFCEEPNLGRGFIKELSISPDGRLICSPFGNGIRFLSFSPTIQDLFYCFPQLTPIPLHELSVANYHSDTVVSTKFSPVNHLIVSGCLSGKIIYYKPQII